MRSLVIASALVLLSAETAEAADKLVWAVFPAQGRSPPPQDPTLLRLTASIGEALHTVVGQDVRVVSRDLRAEACPAFDAVCPKDVAVMVNAEHALSIYLEDDRSKVTLRVYKKRGGFERALELPCEWDRGLVSCETKDLEKLKVNAKREKLKRSEVAKAFKSLKPQLEECAKSGWGSIPEAPRKKKLRVTFLVTAEGRTNEVRITPRVAQTAPALRCMARVVEGLSFDKSGEKLKKLRFPLPRPQ